MKNKLRKNLEKHFNKNKYISKNTQIIFVERKISQIIRILNSIF